MLYLIGIGLHDEKDITVKGLDSIKKADKVYLENYTSHVQSSIVHLEKFYGKKVHRATRDLLENNSATLLHEAQKKDVALLVIGSPLAATTHISLILEAHKQNIQVKVIHNASVLTAVAETGLNLYNFGKIATIPFANKNVKQPFLVLKENLKNDMHTLLLLDVQPGKMMHIHEALHYLLREGMDNRLCVGCAGLGSESAQIKVGTAYELLKTSFTKHPQSLIVPGKLHFVEEEALQRWH